MDFNLDLNEFQRYGRQMIVPGMGLEAQLKLRKSRILVCGAGGLGCPAIAYLAGAGVGTLGIVDPDTVEVSNLHRQILHSKLGRPKCESAREYVQERNPGVTVHTWQEALSRENALEICSQFDVILDCTDSPESRYLINDAAVLLDKPLVSASALRTEGQLALYHYRGGPCYRCLFPRPPPPGTVTACGDGGILGPVVGTMGVLQAVEALKVVTENVGNYVPSLLLYSAMDFPPFRAMKIRGRQSKCDVCGDNPSITVENFSDWDSGASCGAPVGTSQTPIVRTDAEYLRNYKGTVLDVRPAVQFGICFLPGSINIPIDRVRKASSLDELDLPEGPVVIVCRYGNDSQLAARKLRELGATDVRDIRGGLRAWSSIDGSFPVY